MLIHKKVFTDCSVDFLEKKILPVELVSTKKSLGSVFSSAIDKSRTSRVCACILLVWSLITALLLQQPSHNHDTGE
jgi:hypothetical protein